MRGSCRMGVLLGAAVGSATAPIVPGAAVAAQPAFLYMGSQPGEYIGGGAEWRYTHENARFQAGRLPADPSSISIRIDETSCEMAGPALRGSVRVADPQLLGPVAWRVVPRSPRAGRTFTARLRMRDPASGVRVRRVRCLARVEGRELARMRRVVARRGASCAWRLPASTRGMTLRGFVRFEAPGQVVLRRFRARVR